MITLTMVLGLAMPPEKYDYEPTVAYSVHRMSQEEIQSICSPLPTDLIYFGCYKGMGSQHYILLDERLTEEAEAVVLRHEKGHVNGWRH